MAQYCPTSFDCNNQEFLYSPVQELVPLDRKLIGVGAISQGQLFNNPIFIENGILNGCLIPLLPFPPVAPYPGTVNAPIIPC